MDLKVRLKTFFREAAMAGSSVLPRASSRLKWGTKGASQKGNRRLLKVQLLVV